MNTTKENTTPPGVGAAGRPVRSWPVLVLALPAFTAIWSGWVGLGRLTGFGPVELLPGIWDGARINSAITLPIGMETYAAYALHVMLSARVTDRARTFARWSAAGSLVLGAAGQVAYHLMSAAGMTSAPWLITAVVACLPVAVLGMGAALAHLVTDHTPDTEASRDVDVPQGEQDRGEQDTTPAPMREPVAAERVPAKPVPVRRSRSGSRVAGSTGERVARLRAKDPDLSVSEIARRLGVTDRTVRRHLAATTAETTTTEAGPGAEPEAGEQAAA